MEQLEQEARAFCEEEGRVKLFIGVGCCVIMSCVGFVEAASCSKHERDPCALGLEEEEEDLEEHFEKDEALDAVG